MKKLISIVIISMSSMAALADSTPELSSHEYTDKVPAKVADYGMAAAAGSVAMEAVKKAADTSVPSPDKIKGKVTKASEVLGNTNEK